MCTTCYTSILHPAFADLVRTLDARKDEAIARTFKGVAGHFKQVFSELIPKGSASMTILTAGLDDDEDDEEGQDELPVEDLDADATEGAWPADALFVAFRDHAAILTTTEFKNAAMQQLLGYSASLEDKAIFHTKRTFRIGYSEGDLSHNRLLCL